MRPVDPEPETVNTHPHRRYFTFDDSVCEICGERFDGGVVEMYDPNLDLESVLCHSECGLERGLVIA